MVKSRSGYINPENRNADLSRLNGTDMAAVYIGKLCKLKLGKSFSLAVINHIETEFFV